MVLLPSVIVGKKFPKAFRGYAISHVDEFLGDIIKSLEKLHKENTILKGQNMKLADSNINIKNKNAVLIESNASLVREIEEFKNSLRKYKNMENAIQNSLISSQEMSDEILRSAASKAEDLEQEAKLICRELLEQAKHEKEQMIEQTERAKKDLEAYRSELKSSLVMNIEYLNNLDAEAECIDELWITPHTLRLEQGVLNDEG